MAAFPTGRILVFLDNFEDKLNPTTRGVADEKLDETLKAMLGAPERAVKIILTIRLAPRDLALTRPEKQQRLDLNKGLETPYAENILREMDRDGKLGLKSAPPDPLNLARTRTLGNPRALEALFAILSADRHTTLEEILTDAETLLPENVVHALVGEAYNCLDASTDYRSPDFHRLPITSPSWFQLVRVRRSAKRRKPDHDPSGQIRFLFSGKRGQPLTLVKILISQGRIWADILWLPLFVAS